MHSGRMEKNRMEAFSDGVLAIIITIMVLELDTPEGADLRALATLAPVFLFYVLSFTYVGIYWNNHHHLLKASRSVNGQMLWANLHLLFWLSLFPFATRWMGENPNAPLPTALYGSILLLAAVAYSMLQSLILGQEGRESRLAQSIGRDFKGRISPMVYAMGIGLSFVRPWIGWCLYLAVALMWLIPDRRIERVVIENGS